MLYRSLVLRARLTVPEQVICSTRSFKDFLAIQEIYALKSNIGEVFLGAPQSRHSNAKEQAAFPETPSSTSLGFALYSDNTGVGVGGSRLSCGHHSACL